MTGRENQASRSDRILQLEDSTRQTLTEMNSTMQKINYVSYEKKKSKGKKTKQKFQNIL